MAFLPESGLAWAILACCTVALLGAAQCRAEDDGGPVLNVVATDHDFEVTGRGSDEAWDGSPWAELHRRGDGGHDYRSRVKLLYSKTGIYVLMDGTDRRLTATFTDDYKDLWTEDVFEFFFWPDEAWPLYFEYEISPLGRELPILIPNFDGDFLGWRPWHYEGDRRTRKAVHIVGGPQESGAVIAGWRAEVFVPYGLLKPLKNVPPRRGTRWRANFYRVDYDEIPALEKAEGEALASAVRRVFLGAMLPQRTDAVLTIKSGLSRGEAIARFADPLAADTWSLSRAWRDMNNPKLPDPERRQAAVMFHSKIALPLANLVLVLISLPLAVRYARTPGLSLGLSVIIAVGFYLVFLFGRSMGEIGILPPALAAWGADLIFTAIGLAWLRG